uniref:Uncharacterized protein n=1 Tax=Anguilla anguilla TaxID=7936 RepID=A0A0E9S0E1_ANGAN
MMTLLHHSRSHCFGNLEEVDTHPDHQRLTNFDFITFKTFDSLSVVG